MEVEKYSGIMENPLIAPRKDYADQGKIKVMEIKGEEFIRRFLLHVLPHHFVKIRHYGILSNRNRKTKLKVCKELFGIHLGSQTGKKKPWEEMLLESKGIDVKICPQCGKGTMLRREFIIPRTDLAP